LTINRQPERSLIVNVNLHLTDDTPLRAWGFVLGGALFAQVYWDCSHPDNPLGHGSISGTPQAMRRLAALAMGMSTRSGPTLLVRSGPTPWCDRGPVGGW
jgi:hypothetical protein